MRCTRSRSVWPTLSGSFPALHPDQQSRIEQEIGELRRQIAAEERVLADPQAATQRTQERIARPLEREREPEERPAVGRRAKFINPPPSRPSTLI